MKYQSSWAARIFMLPNTMFNRTPQSESPPSSIATVGSAATSAAFAPRLRALDGADAAAPAEPGTGLFIDAMLVFPMILLLGRYCGAGACCTAGSTVKFDGFTLAFSHDAPGSKMSSH